MFSSLTMVFSLVEKRDRGTIVSDLIKCMCAECSLNILCGSITLPDKSKPQ